MSENPNVKRRLVLGLAALMLALGLALALDFPSRFRDTPAEEASGPDAAVLAGCLSACEGKGSTTAFCESYCPCMLESLRDGRSPKEVSAFVMATAKGPSAEQRDEMDAKTQACTERAHAAEGQ